ncbi:hypothetical protein [Saccharibacillus deserti]|uniref:hypothetical protein n=1 Tax=Saccharibacillus deserti TaxID=1634444 RepID=UPI00155705F4|nr:hypothetical protein [Saccharibacillus deserti]
MRAEQKREMRRTTGSTIFSLAFLIILLPIEKDLLGILIAGNLIGLIISLVRIRNEETSGERFVRKREENGPPGFWRGTFSESGRIFAQMIVGLMILALLLYWTEGTNLVQTLVDQSLETIGLITLILVIVSFLLGAVGHNRGEERYERLKQRLECRD